MTTHESDYTVEAQESPALTKRETDVLDGLCRGMSNKQIAGSLNISEKTVKAHCTAIFKKWGVASRAECIVKAVQKLTAAFGGIRPTKEAAQMDVAA